ncbi:unannotated protein [freshwater metagenome]|uniref:Unannotated protein n=1 Tax=freshwater metagenome TaxID=449393 RepID=A0A6J7QHJ5_9ZZZZ
MASRESASDPHTVGPIPGCSDGPTMTAPAPSAKINAVARSSGSVKSLNFSTPTTRTCFEVPLRTKSLAMPRP